MRGAPTVLWTCNRCGRTEATLAESHPPAWRTVGSKHIDGGGSDYEGDWCRACIEVHLTPKETFVSDLGDQHAAIMGVLDAHRYDTLGVSFVSCECGQVIHSENDTLTKFPADEAFRRHIAAEVLRVLQSDVG